MELTLWQKKQAALLYYFASTEFLMELKNLADKLMAFADGTLSTAEAEQRDQFLKDARWGMRDTAENWSNNAWPFLLDFRASLMKDLAARKSDSYKFTGTNQFIRGTNEYSLQWTTPAEEQVYDDLMQQISHRGCLIDSTLAKHHVTSRWDDHGFAMEWDEFKSQFKQLPRFRVCPAIEGVTGEAPPRTGVYICQDDIHGALQFASRRGTTAELLECPTFNEIGLRALAFVGRRELWFNVPKMYSFANLPENRDLFRSGMSIMDEVYPDLAASAVAKLAFKSRPCKWYFVEMVEGEFEDYDDSTIPGVADDRVRVLEGEPCPRAGYYLTPAKDGSRRYFEQGEIMPDFPNKWGTVIWQSAE